MSYDVFISHSSANKKPAQNLCEFLESNGYSCWIAPRDIQISEDWPNAIMRGIKSTRTMVVLLTRQANDSPEVANEVHQAAIRYKETLEARKSNAKVDPYLIVTLKIDNIEPSDGIAYNLSRQQWLTATKRPIDNHFPAVLKVIRDHLEGKNTPVAAVKKPDAPVLTPLQLYERKVGDMKFTYAFCVGGSLFLGLAVFIYNMVNGRGELLAWDYASTIPFSFQHSIFRVVSVSCGFWFFANIGCHLNTVEEMSRGIFTCSLFFAALEIVSRNMQVVPSIHLATLVAVAPFLLFPRFILGKAPADLNSAGAEAMPDPGKV